MTILHLTLFSINDARELLGLARISKVITEHTRDDLRTAIRVYDERDRKRIKGWKSLTERRKEIIKHIYSKRYSVVVIYNDFNNIKTPILYRQYINPKTSLIKMTIRDLGKFKELEYLFVNQSSNRDECECDRTNPVFQYDVYHPNPVFQYDVYHHGAELSEVLELMGEK